MIQLMISTVDQGRGVSGQLIAHVLLKKRINDESGQLEQTFVC